MAESASLKHLRKIYVDKFVDSTAKRLSQAELHVRSCCLGLGAWMPNAKMRSVCMQCRSIPASNPFQHIHMHAHRRASGS